MLLILCASIALIVAVLFLIRTIGFLAVKDAIKLGINLLDLVQLLATLRYKSAAVRQGDW